MRVGDEGRGVKSSLIFETMSRSAVSSGQKELFNEREMLCLHQ